MVLVSKQPQTIRSSHWPRWLYPTTKQLVSIWNCPLSISYSSMISKAGNQILPTYQILSMSQLLFMINRDFLTEITPEWNSIVFLMTVRLQRQDMKLYRPNEVFSCHKGVCCCYYGFVNKGLLCKIEIYFQLSHFMCCFFCSI